MLQIEGGRVVHTAKVDLSGKLWDPCRISSGETIFRPRYMLSAVEWTNVSAAKDAGLPFVRVQYSGDQISEIEAFPGVVREVPVFYSLRNGVLSIADSPKKIMGKCSGYEEPSIVDFLAFGYVTGNRTVFKSIYSLSAGELLRFSDEKCHISMELLYNSYAEVDADEVDLLALLSKTTSEVFESFFSAIKGKSVLLPLSAGYDSRFIAAMLKIGGIEDVSCFAWGNPENVDVQRSKAIASTLGFRWEAIDCSEAAWKKALDSEWILPLLREASNCVSISGAASIPFQAYLRERDMENCVVVPGHTGDFISGGHIPDSLDRSSSAKEVSRAILKKHLLGKYKQEDSSLFERILYQVHAFVPFMQNYRVFEAWELRERQSKFIANTNRYYEPLGISWAMPLWDVRFVKFWSCVPLEQKRRSALYRRFLENDVFESLGISSWKKDERSAVRKKLALLKRFQSFNWIVARALNNRPVKSEHGFEQVLPSLHSRVREHCPNGFRKMQEYSSDYGFQAPQRHYDYLSRSVLALLLDE